MTDDALRAEILARCGEFYRSAHSAKPFEPGKTYIPVSVKSMDATDLEALVDASLDMWLTAGRYSDELEVELPRHFGRTTRSLLVNSGSSANLVALTSLCTPMMQELYGRALQPGDEVITAAAGFPTTVNPIVQNGLTPVFIDVELETLNASFEHIRAAQTEKTRAVMLAHTLGNPFRADLLETWCKQEGLFLIEDCCDALGAEIGDRLVGSFGDYATASFYPAHHITMGEGGAVMPRSGRLKRIAASVRDWGRDCWCDPGKDDTCNKRFDWELGELPSGYDHKYIYANVGYNLKLTDMQAALGVSQLRRVGGFIARRRENWEKLYRGVLSSPVLKRSLRPVVATQGTRPSWFGFPIHCEPGVNRDTVVRYLEEHRVGTRLLFAGNLTRQPAYRNVNFRVAEPLENTNRILEGTFWIGAHPLLDDERIAYMLEQLEGAVRAAESRSSLPVVP